MNGKATALNITSPFGYGKVVPLRNTDKVLLPAAGAVPEFCRSANALAISVSEFNRAARDYPIVFASADAGRTYSPVAVLGLADAQNLFVGASGGWDEASYVPAFARRYPFCIAKRSAADALRDEKLVCVASASLGRRGAALFDADGAPTPQWQAALGLLREFENDLDATARMCAEFAELELYSAFSFQVMHKDAAALKLQGMHRIDEKKLAALKPGKHQDLVARGLMGKIYAHIHSLENFARLYQRALARAAAPARRKRGRR